MAQKLCDACDSLVFASDAACWECGGNSFTTLDDGDVAHIEADAGRPRSAEAARGGEPSQTTWASAAWLLLVVALPWGGVRLMGWWGLLAVGLVWPIQRFFFPKHWRDDLKAAAAREEARRVDISAQKMSRTSEKAEAERWTRADRDQERRARREQKSVARAARERWAVSEVRGEGMIRFRLGDGYLDAIKECVDRHANTLARKHTILFRRDDYGIDHPEAWGKERDYFVERIVFPALRNAVRTHARRNRALARYFEEPTHPLESAMPIPLVLQALRFASPKRDALRVIADVIADQVSERRRAQAQDTRPFVPSTPIAAGVEFEHHCAGRLRAAGWEVSVTTASGDQGVDVVAIRGGFRLAVQCKWYASPVGNEAVQQVAAGCSFYGAHAGLVVSNAGYTEAARRLAATTGVILIDEAGLVAGAERARTHASL